MILSKSGIEVPLSHFDTDWRDTPSCTASSSWDHPFCLRRFKIFSANIIVPFLSCCCFYCLNLSRISGCAPPISLENLSTGGCTAVNWGDFTHPFFRKASPDTAIRQSAAPQKGLISISRGYPNCTLNSRIFFSIFRITSRKASSSLPVGHPAPSSVLFFREYLDRTHCIP